MARAPQDSEVAVIKFSKNAKYIAKKSFKAGSKKDLQLIFKGLDNAVPSGPTNLVSGLIQAEKFKPTNIYLITDGLPTFGGERFKSLIILVNAIRLLEALVKFLAIAELNYLNKVLDL